MRFNANTVRDGWNRPEDDDPTDEIDRAEMERQRDEDAQEERRTG